MATKGEIKSLYTDMTETTAIFPRTKVKAITDDNGVGLNAILEDVAYVGPQTGLTATSPVNAETLGGRPAEEYATQSFVTNKIAEAQLNGDSNTSNIDLSGYATKDFVFDNLPSATSDLTNDSGYITEDSVPTKLSQLANDAGYITDSDVDSALASVNSALSGKIGGKISTWLPSNGANPTAGVDGFFSYSTHPGLVPSYGFPSGFSEYGTIFGNTGTSYPVIMYVDVFGKIAAYNTNQGAWTIPSGSGSGTSTPASPPNYVLDKTTGTPTYFNFASDGMTTTDWIAAWDGYTLRAISPSSLKGVLGVPSSSITQIGNTTTTCSYDYSNDNSAWYSGTVTMDWTYKIYSDGSAEAVGISRNDIPVWTCASWGSWHETGQFRIPSPLSFKARPHVEVAATGTGAWYVSEGATYVSNTVATYFCRATENVSERAYLTVHIHGKLA